MITKLLSMNKHIYVKVYTFPYLLNLILENEEIYQSTQYEHTNYNAMLSDCILEAENPLFKYEPMFSEDRNHDVNYKF